MKKMNRWKHVAKWIVVIMVITMTGCSSSSKEPESTPFEPAPTTETVVAEPEPEVTEPEQEDAVAEPEPEVEEPEVVEEDNPNIIDGIDFTAFNESGGIKKLYEAINTMDYDELRWVVESGHCKIIAILADGDTFDVEYHSIFMIYAPKRIEDCVVEEGNVNLLPMKADEIRDGILYGIFFYDDDFSSISPEGSNITVSVVYEDGTTELITITLYKAE